VDADSIPTRSTNVVARRGPDDVTILLDTTSGRYYTLDDVGGRVWELADGTNTVAEIASRLASEYEAPLEQIEADVRELLGDLSADELVHG
jgi:hypothetical protein